MWKGVSVWLRGCDLFLAEKKGESGVDRLKEMSQKGPSGIQQADIYVCSYREFAWPLVMGWPSVLLP